MNRYRNLIIGIITVILAYFLLAGVYNIIDSRETDTLTLSEEQRSGIESPSKKLLNGHLGVFFRFRSMGNINWLAIPLVLWFLFTGKRKKRERWQLALALVWFLTAVFVGIKGYYNARYQVTLFPFTIFLILVLLWEFLKAKAAYLKVVSYSLLAIVCIYNVYHYADAFGFFWDLKVTRKTAHFPTRIVNFLNRNEKVGTGREMVYLFNQPLYYYHTKKKGIDYMSPFHYEMFLRMLDKTGNRRRMYNLFRRKYKVKYILVAWTLVSQYKDRMMSEFLNCETNLIIDEYGYQLYQIRDNLLSRELENPKYKKLKGVELFNMTNLGIRGKFDFKKKPDKNRFIVSNTAPDKEGNRLIQLGFNFKDSLSNEVVSAGQYVHLIIEARIPSHLANRSNYIFIQDKKEENSVEGKSKGLWEKDTLYFSAPYWRTYLLSRKIRYGSTQFSMGIRFVPESPEDKLAIKNVVAFVSPEPL